MQRKWLVTTFGLALVGIAVANTLWFRPWSIQVFFDRVTIENGLQSPETLSSTRILAPYGLHWYDGKLDDISDARRDADLARAKANLAMLKAYDRDSLSASNQLSYDAMRWALEGEVAGERFRDHDYPVNQLDGPALGVVNFLTNIHTIDNERDARHYLDRLQAVPRLLAQLRTKLAARANRGIVAPHFALAKAAIGMRELVAVPSDSNPLYTTFKTRLDKAGIPADVQTPMLAEANELIAKSIYPAYRDLIDDTERLAQAHPRNDGVWALPDGDAYYAWQLAQHTTTTMTPDQVHALGLQEVARIEGEIKALLKQVGEPSDNVGVALKRLAEDPRFVFADTDAGRAEVLAGYKAILAEAQAALPKAFGHLPAASLDVRRAPAVSEKTAPGAYYESAALDGSRPGVFYTALYDIKATQRWAMHTLAFHEGVPGHHLQGSIAQEQTDLPLFRRFTWYDAYGEGWALYAERLGWEMGLEPDPYDQIGRLRDELFRAVRLVVDTGMHAKHWTREQAIDYMEGKTGIAHSDVVVEVERYLVWPGQACSYKVGMIKILALRDKARRQLGAQFDLRRFHDVILRNGAIPLDLLARLVDDWIAGGGKG